MAQESIYRYVRRGVAAADLNALVEAQPGDWFYGERPPDTVLVWASGALDGGLAWADWRHGRRFGPEGELAWWPEAGGAFTCRLLAGPGAAGWEGATEYTAADDEVNETLLHGLYDEDSDPPTWSEARIPRYLAYPVEDNAPGLNTRAVLLTRGYRGPAGDRLERLLAVETKDMTPKTEGQAAGGPTAGAAGG